MQCHSSGSRLNRGAQRRVEADALCSWLRNNPHKLIHNLNSQITLLGSRGDKPIKVNLINHGACLCDKIDVSETSRAKTLEGLMHVSASLLNPG